MTRQHYHLMISIPGCMPDTNDIYTNKRDAISAAQHDVDFLRSGGDKWRGSGKTGLWIRADGMYYVSVDPCTDVSCDDESDDC